MARFLGIALAILAVAAIPATVQADTITLTDWGTGDFAANAAGGGGPFLATTDSVLVGSGFITFCLEYNEHFSYGTAYNFVLSDAAKAGGVSGGIGGSDPVDDATKWLYYQAVSGGYSPWYAGVTGMAIDSHVGANFQNAIWYLEGERTLAEIGGLTSAGYRMADCAGSQDWDSLYDQGHRVYAMNLTTICAPGAVCAPVQDQLAYVAPVPEPGSTLLLLGTGLIGLAGASRRRLRK